METPSAASLLEAWEHGQERGAAQRGLLLLHTAFPDLVPDALASIPIGPKNRMLLGLHGRLFGFEVEGVTACAGCGEALEARLALGADDVAPVVRPGPTTEVHELSCDGHDVRFRLPNTSDLIELPPGDIDDVARWLLLRCIVEARHEGAELPVADLPASVGEAVAEALAQLDPDGVVELLVTCARCGGTTATPLDPSGFLWAEVDQWAWRTLGEVRDLASAYGWSEGDILAMTPWRRQAYMELLPA